MKLPPGAYRVAHRLRRIYWRVFSPTTLGVRMVAFDAEGNVLLVRHTYMPGWYLPGGGLKSKESLDQAARRELREETGLEAVDVALVGAFTNVSEGKTDHVLLFRTDNPSGDLSPASPEIAEIRWFRPDALPDDCPAGTRRRIGELSAGSNPLSTGRW